LMATLIHWFPKRNFIFLGDGGYASVWQRNLFTNGKSRA